MAEEELIGKISHYFKNINVGIIELAAELSVGDIIHIKGPATNFEQKIDSMQIDHEQVDTAGAGQGVGVKVIEKVREGDEVFKVA